MGALLGPFWLNRPLAAGGMGEVWAGVHREQGLQVAIKFLTRDAHDPDFRAAFDAEVSAMASLDHPNVVRIYDYGETGEQASSNLRERVPDGTPYIVMEQARGTLSDRAEALPWATVHTALRHLLAALAHAHARGLLHRDLKPGNVLLCPGEREGDADRVVLTDFGFAGRAGDRASVVVGLTPSYAAPEQLRWDTRREGPWTDLFALGCLAWRLLTGVPPFHADSVEQALAKQEKGLPRLQAKVPAGVRDWLARAMDPRPMGRFPSAADALSALADAVEGRRMTLAGIPRSSQDISLRRPTIHLSGTGLGLVGRRHQALVGREAQRTQLWAWLRECARGRSRVVVIRGPEGIGTSHLARWLHTRAHERAGLVALWADHPERPTSESGVAGMLRRILHVDGLGPRKLERALGRRLKDHGVDASRAHAYAVLLTGGGTAGDRVRGFLEMLSIVGRGRVVVVVLDKGAHDADSIALARAAAADLSRRVLVVLTAGGSRTPERAPVATAVDALVALAEVQELRLKPLSDAEVDRLLRQFLRLDDAVAGEVAELSAGNPAVMLNMIGGWVEQGVLQTGADGHWHVAPGASIELPDEVLRPWLERVERALVGWDEAAGRCLELAAVLGHRVSEPWWLAGCRELRAPPPDGLIAHLSSRGLVRPDPRRGDPGWSFTDGRVRAALLRRAQRHGRLQRLHAVIADLLPHNEPSRAPHLLRCGRVNEALLPLYSGMMRRMRDRPAALGARSLSELESAVHQLALPPSDARQGWVLRGRASLELARGDLDAVEVAANALLQSSRTHDWAKMESRALRLLCAAARRRLDLATAVSLAMKALESAKTPLDEAQAFRELAAAERLRGRMKAASSYVKEGRARSAGRDSLEGWLWVEVARIGLSVRRVKDAVRALGRARACFAKAGDQAGYCAVSEAQGWAALEDGEYRVADQRLRSAQQAWRESGQKRNAVRTLMRRGVVAAMAGEYERALRQMREVAAVVESVGDRRLELVARLGVAAVTAVGPSSRTAKATIGLLCKEIEATRVVDPEMARLLVLASSTHDEAKGVAQDQLRRLGRRGEADALGEAQ